MEHSPSLPLSSPLSSPAKKLRNPRYLPNFFVSSNHLVVREPPLPPVMLSTTSFHGNKQRFDTPVRSVVLKWGRRQLLERSSSLDLGNRKR
ncbi:unnamed protein product [Linum trigynum]|uniref:Uncharacterized protein n=1 Tax=Linum trigynum TaxID=586398 RepID=A0AAV2F2C7_9ROSI